MNKRILYFIVVLTLTLSGLAFGSENTVLLSPGDKFPNLDLQDQLSSPDKNYLGIKIPFFSFNKKEDFLLEEIQADLLFIEFFNKYCTGCQLQAPVNNKIFEHINSNKDLKQKVKFIGIGAGNSLGEVNSFKQEKNISFPLIPDQDFKSYEDIGDPGGTPYMLLVKKSGPDLTVYSSHMGLNKDADYFIKEIKTALKTDVRSVVQKKNIVDLKLKERNIVLNISEKEIVQNVNISIKRVLKDEPAADKIKITRMTGHKGLYRSEVISGLKKGILYTKLLSRKPVCDVCHGIHFMVTFDASGIIRDVHAIHLTKYGNVRWDEKDIRKVNRRLAGRKIDGSLQYDSKVDAITTATMSTALLYNSIKRLAPLVEELKMENQ